MKFIETSAKSASNVVEAFETMTKEIIQIKKQQVVVDEEKKKKTININEGKQLGEKKGCC